MGRVSVRWPPRHGSGEDHAQPPLLPVDESVRSAWISAPVMAHHGDPLHALAFPDC